MFRAYVAVGRNTDCRAATGGDRQIVWSMIVNHPNGNAPRAGWLPLLREISVYVLFAAPKLTLWL